MLNYADILFLLYRCCVYLFIPSNNKKDSDECKGERTIIHDHILSTIVLTLDQFLSADEKYEYYQQQLQKHIVQREGKGCHGFNVRIKSYPERSQLEGYGVATSVMKYLMGGGGMGCTLSCVGMAYQKNFCSNSKCSLTSRYFNRENKRLRYR